MVQPALPGAPDAPIPGIPRPGELVADKYLIERVLGMGGMGVVLAARHRFLEQRFAIKLLLPDAAASSEAISRFMREAQAASSIRSEHVARIVDVGSLANGLPFMVMEFLDGQDLGQLLQRGPLPIQDAVDLVLQACEAIAQAHAQGVVHRDLKPANLFLSHRPNGERLIKVLDFGISKVTQGNSGIALTATSFAFGTPLYMSPEQIRSAKYVDPRTDIWALGVILHELIGGRPPFEGESLTALCAAITVDPPRPLRADRPDAPPELEAAIQHTLQKDVRARPGSVLEFATMIAPFGSPQGRFSLQQIERINVPTLPPLPRPSGPAIDPNSTHSSWETGRLPGRSTSRWLAAAVAGTLLAGVIGAFAAHRWLGPTTKPAAASSTAASAPLPPPTPPSASTSTVPATSATVLTSALSPPSGPPSGRPPSRPSPPKHGPVQTKRD